MNLDLALLDTLLKTGNGWSISASMVPISGTEGAILQPPTFASDEKKRDDSPYLLHQRKMGGKEVNCVTLNTVQAEANEHEAVLEQVLQDAELNLFFPQIRLALTQVGLDLSTAELPHRCADARLRDAELDGVPFRQSDLGRAILDSHNHDMTGLYLHDVRTFLHGVWDSHAFTIEKNQRQKMGRTLRLSRLITAEITGVNISVRDRRAQLNDPLHFSAELPIKEGYGDRYYENLDVKEGKNEAASVGLASIPANQPGRGGVSVESVLYESYVPVAILRRYRFPVDGKHDRERDHAARAVIAALALLSQALRVNQGSFSLRSGCDLMWEEGPPPFTFYGRGRTDILFQGPVSPTDAYTLFEQAYARAKNLGLGWEEGKVYRLDPCEAFKKRIAKNLEWEDGSTKSSKSKSKKGK